MAPPPPGPPPPPPAPGPSNPRRRGRAIRNIAIATVTAGSLALVGVSVASAQSSGSTTTTPSTAAPSTASPPTTLPGAPKPGAHARGGPGGAFRGPGGPGGPGGFGFGAGGSIHGEFVRPNGSGGYQTIDTQSGVVQPGVSATSIEVKSVDGVQKTYTVTTNTVVNSGRDGIGSVKAGDTVQIEAVVNGSTAEAASIVDTTALGSIQGHWRPQPPATAAPATPAPSTTTPSTTKP